MIRHIGEAEFVRKVRTINGVTILFHSKDEIFATDGTQIVLCERWFDGRNVYTERWRPFSQALLHKKGIETCRDIWKLANRYDISAMTSRRFPEINNAKQLED